MALSSPLRRLLGRAPRPATASDDGGLFQKIVEQSADVICRVTGNEFSYVSPSARQVFGWDPEKLVGTDGLGVVDERDRASVLNVISRLMSGEVARQTVQVRMVCEDGSLKWAEVTSHTELTSAGDETVIVMRDVSERKRLEQELEALALQDGLTGLANRRSFDQKLQSEWRRTLRQGGEMALVLLDLDHFKDFNDLYGHQAGDDCLKAVAACLQGKVRRASDIACRYGGEELALILGATDLDGARSLAEEVREAIASLAIPHERSQTGCVTASIGVAAVVARGGGTIRMPEGLIQSADHALYRAKSAGRNAVECAVLIAPAD